MDICVKCVYHDEFEGDDLCDNTDLPISEFIHGRRYCDDLNTKGDCKGFKPQAEPYIPDPPNGSPWEPENACVECKP